MGYRPAVRRGERRPRPSDPSARLRRGLLRWRSYDGGSASTSSQGVTVARPRTAARTVEHPDLSQVSLQQFLEALVDPVRRMVVSQLSRAGEDLSCGTFDAPVSASTLTHHFNVLREAGVVRQY